MSLKDKLVAQIRAVGPIGLDAYMTACLHDPDFGYYATRPRLGEDGDFITAPLISQMFGELIGLWAIETWSQIGKPSTFRLVEVGPGDGTLMVDALRAAKLAPDFLAAADLWLVETSGPLAARQREALAGTPATWAASLDEVPTGAPLILIANEVLDCLPVTQFVRRKEGWTERVVGLDDAGELAFGLGPPRPAQDMAPEGTLIEMSAAQADFTAAVARRVLTEGGAALLIDYGGEDGAGDTLQALRGHQKEEPLENPGEADLTVHADFRAVRMAVKATGAKVAILPQGEFLRRLGIDQRAQRLAAAEPGKADVIARQLDRLTGENQMGRLFQVACLYRGADGPPPGFAA
jgi:NADH dehydrogenase [ubiquinone] 1 alpha subcomplex assembly factor 7